MKQWRLAGLLAIMGAMIVVRWLVPNPPVHDSPVQDTTAQAVVRPARAPVNTDSTNDLTRGTARSTPLEAQPVSSLDADLSGADLPGNAFAARPPPVLAPAPALPPVTSAPVGPPPPLAPAPIPSSPTFSVIGTWDDGVEPGVFVSTPSGTRLARPGTVLMAEYRVTALTPQQLLLEHVTTKREYRLNVPRVPGK